MKNNFKNIFIIIGLIASVMVILGGLMGWFSFPSDLRESVRNSSEVQEILNAKKSMSMFIGFVCLALVLLAARLRKLFLPIIILLLSGYIAFATLNHLREKSDLKDFDISLAPGYWISMAGSLALLVAAVGIIINILKKPQPVGAALPQMPSTNTSPVGQVLGTPNIPPTPPALANNPVYSEPTVPPVPQTPMPNPMPQQPQVSPTAPAPHQPQQQVPYPIPPQPNPTANETTLANTPPNTTPPPTI